MAVKLNERAFAQARELIVDRRIVLDERDDWSAHQPSARDVTLFIAAHGWDAYGPSSLQDIRAMLDAGRYAQPCV